MNVVWLKRDLRTLDHRPLLEASENGPVLCLYVYEAEVVNQPDYSAIHHQFINQCLLELRERLEELGGVLVIRRGRVVHVLESLLQEFGHLSLWSHREVGTTETFDRDKEVAAWAKAKRIVWTEHSQNGVIRKLRDRDGWAKRWSQMMRQTIVAEPNQIDSPVMTYDGAILSSEDFGLLGGPLVEEQLGGSREARQWLESFLYQRGRYYRGEISSPLTAFHSCSRVSPYLAWGAISVRQVYHATVVRRNELKRASNPDARWLKSLSSFLSRLSWHCHFMQKLEDQPNIHCVNIARSFDHLRVHSWNEDYYMAWKHGQTGYPMVDACMRALRATGYLNFRMRAMLMSFASYHLWLDWKRTGQFLARQFLDYEPGIHWSQVQMQSGTTGINTIRVYSPTKQGQDHDPDGEFIKSWVPELAKVPLAYIHEPHHMPEMEQVFANCVIGRDYPHPVVEHKSAYRYAQDRLHAVRQTQQAREEAKQVMQKHGSRKRKRI